MKIFNENYLIFYVAKIYWKKCYHTWIDLFKIITSVKNKFCLNYLVKCQNLAIKIKIDKENYGSLII